MFQRASIAFLAVAAAGALQASTIQTERFNIPFAFHLHNEHRTLPPGQYQVQQESGSNLAVLVNTKTGDRVQVLRSPTTHAAGKAKLVFENKNDVHSLRRIF
jgi:hypothetical protein